MRPCGLWRWQFTTGAQNRQRTSAGYSRSRLPRDRRVLRLLASDLVGTGSGGASDSSVVDPLGPHTSVVMGDSKEGDGDAAGRARGAPSEAGESACAGDSGRSEPSRCSILATRALSSSIFSMMIERPERRSFSYRSAGSTPDQPAVAASAATSRTLLGSIRMPGLMVEDSVTVLTYRPLAAAGLALTTSSTTAK